MNGLAFSKSKIRRMEAAQNDAQLGGMILLLSGDSAARTCRRWGAKVAIGLAGVLLAGMAQAQQVEHRANVNTLTSTPAHAVPQQKAAATAIERGRYLARLGNCMGCHTARGQASYAGGRAIETPFGTAYSTNITPDAETGIGRWSQDDFWRALHEGRSRDGRLLTPAFPYTSFTRITRQDSNALHSYLQTVPAATQANRPQGLQFPFGTQTALWVWQTLYFKPIKFQPVADRSAEWNRGAYLVQGLGHCSACHTPRNALGAEKEGSLWAGGIVPGQNWYAPALSSVREAGVAHWSDKDVQQLLQTGVNAQASVMGPMAEVVATSTQYLTNDDARAMATYLKTLSPSPKEPTPTVLTQPADSALESGRPAAQLYKTHCASCHGEKGEGEDGAFIALAGNRAVQMSNPTNVLRVILQGGYGPSTAGNPRPYGMPPFQASLSDSELAAVASLIRSSWGNAAPVVTLTQAHRARERQVVVP